jgi:hypothetical protein
MLSTRICLYAKQHTLFEQSRLAGTEAVACLSGVMASSNLASAPLKLVDQMTSASRFTYPNMVLVHFSARYVANAPASPNTIPLSSISRLHPATAAKPTAVVRFACLNLETSKDAPT